MIEMTVLRTTIFVAWVVFWVSWLLAAAAVKPGSRRPGRGAPGLLVLLVVFGAARGLRLGDATVHSVPLAALGTVLFFAGLGLAVWARLHLGRNWGMPMTTKDEPELVTSGPYRLVRHPIYSGVLLAMLGTALATSLYALVAFLALSAYFIYCALVEERLMSREFPNAYPSYRARTKMLVPFVL